jgi:hypothetical protein
VLTPTGTDCEPLHPECGRRRTPFPYSGRIMVGVFLSHSSKDKPFVSDLANALEAGGEIRPDSFTGLG